MNLHWKDSGEPPDEISISRSEYPGRAIECTVIHGGNGKWTAFVHEFFTGMTKTKKPRPVWLSKGVHSPDGHQKNTQREAKEWCEAKFNEITAPLSPCNPSSPA